MHDRDIHGTKDSNSGGGEASAHGIFIFFRRPQVTGPSLTGGSAVVGM